MNKTWSRVNIFILIIQGLICFIGLFKHISFGAGLGDLFWYVLMFLLFFMHLILFAKLKNNKYLKVIAILFSVTTLYIILSATIYRGAEYRWNGKLFWEPNKNSVIIQSKK